MENKCWQAVIGLCFVLILTGLACGGETAVLPADSELQTTSFKDGDFQLALPKWPVVEHSDENTLTAVSQNGQTIAIARHELVPRIVERYFLKILPDYGDFYDLELAENGPGDVVIDGRISGPVEQKLRIRFSY